MIKRNWAILEDGAVTMQRFAGGYFDANGVANYYLTDYQGNVTEVVNASGAVVQSVRYYPDGEPWMEPTGTNRYTFGGKERVNLGGLNQYDFGPRLLNAAAGVWGSPDRKAEKYYGISPYGYCAGNPVMNVDPTGEDVFIIIRDNNKHLAMLIQNEDESWKYYSINGNNIYVSGGFYGGKEFNDVGVGSWNSPQEFLDSPYNTEESDSKETDPTVSGYNYKEGYQIETTPEQDEVMRRSFHRKAKTEYDFFNNNCATVVQEVLLEAGIPISGETKVTYYPVSTSYGLIEVPRIELYETNNKTKYPKDAYHNIMEINPGGKIIRKSK